MNDRVRQLIEEAAELWAEDLSPGDLGHIWCSLHNGAGLDPKAREFVALAENAMVARVPYAGPTDPRR